MFITSDHIRKNSQILFVFGDNDTRKGLGGMAKEFRGEPNAIGIRTKKKPYKTPDSYYTDSEFDSNVQKINEDIIKIKKISKEYVCLYVPDEIGKGLALLNIKAPKTYDYLLEEILKLYEWFKK